MSGTSVANLFTPVITAAIDSIWNQWAAIGGSARGTGAVRCIIDPEALILASHELVPREARLAEVMGAWLRVHADVVSVQRLSNLAGRAAALPHHDVSQIAALARQGPNGHRWKRLAGSLLSGEQPSAARRETPPLIMESAGTIMLRLRLAMGVGVKSDALAYLLGVSSWRSVQEVTRATGYTVAAVRRGLDEMALARFIESEEPVEWRARRSRHLRADPSQWQALLQYDGAFPAWGYWRERFDFVVHISQWMNEENATQQWNEMELGDWGKRWMTQHPLAFRFGDDDRAAFRGRLADWAEHFRESLLQLTAWLTDGTQ